MPTQTYNQILNSHQSNSAEAKSAVTIDKNDSGEKLYKDVLTEECKRSIDGKLARVSANEAEQIRESIYDILLGIKKCIRLLSAAGYYEN